MNTLDDESRANAVHWVMSCVNPFSGEDGYDRLARELLARELFIDTKLNG